MIVIISKNPLSADDYTYLYTGDVNVVTDNLLQTMEIHTSCSYPLLLGDQFGSIELIEFYNKDQGIISFYENATLYVNVHFPFSVHNGDNDVGVTTMTRTNITLTDISIQNLSNHSASDPTTNYDKMVEYLLVDSLLATDVSRNDDRLF